MQPALDWGQRKSSPDHRVPRELPFARVLHPAIPLRTRRSAPGRNRSLGARPVTDAKYITAFLPQYSTVRLTKTLINIYVCVYCSCSITTLQYPIIQFTSKFTSDNSFFSPMHGVMIFHMWREECVCRKAIRSVRLY
jgi:hypothetical protein